MKRLLKRAVWITIVLAIVAVVAVSFRPTPVPVDVGEAHRGELLVTVSDDGITRVRERFTISAPIRGRLIRTPLDAGDEVRKGETTVAEFAPIAPDPLDARGLAEARARYEQAVAAVEEAEARQRQAVADDEYARAELARVEKLVAEDIRTGEARERAKRDAERAGAGLRAAGFLVEMARFGVALAKAGLREIDRLPDDVTQRETEPGDKRPTLRLPAPISGRVLRVFEESARTVAPGTPIVELGDVRTLEIVAEFLSQDAVKVRAGMPAAITGWGGTDQTALRGRVRHVEPSGFTKISALGVEEQRVNVLIDPAPDADWSQLRDGYRVVPRIELWRGRDVLQVPGGALFRKGGAWAVFVVRDGIARLQKVRIGRRSGLAAEVREGLMGGDVVILYPSDLVADGQPVAPR